MAAVINKVINGDCVEVMKELAEDSNFLVDAIITDPPYNISKKNNFHTMKGRKGIDFGEWDKGFNQLEWLKYANELLKPGGSIIIFNCWKNLGLIAEYMETTFKYSVKDIIRWVKQNPMPRNRDRRYITDYEFAIWLVKPGDKWVFNRQSATYERPEIKASSPNGKVRQHPTQKPLELMEHLIKIHTNEGDIILDPFIGSGSTGVAAINLKRKFVGIELDRNYCAIANNRITKWINENERKTGQMNLFEKEIENEQKTTREI